MKTKEEVLEQVYSNQIIKDMLSEIQDENKKKEIIEVADKAIEQFYKSLFNMSQSIKNNPPANLNEEIDKKTILKDR